MSYCIIILHYYSELFNIHLFVHLFSISYFLQIASRTKIALLIEMKIIIDNI